MKLLIVDDSLMILRHAEGILRRSGLPVEITTSQMGSDTVELIRKNGIQIVLLDIIMPGTSGIDILRLIKGDSGTKDTEVLMFSSLSDKETLTTCFELGASDYIAKPIDELEFLARVKSVIRKKNMEIEETAYLKEIESQNIRLKDLNAKLNDAKGQLLQQEKMASVGHLAAGVAHEINNPLGFVTSNITTLKQYTRKYRELSEQVMNFVSLPVEQGLDPAFIIPFKGLREYVRKADFDFINSDLEDLYKDTHDGLDRVSKIVKGLRNFSRIDNMDERSAYDLKEGIENTLVISRNELKYAASLELDLGEVPEIVAAGGQINQVILNILLNACAAVKSRFAPALGQIFIRTWAEGEHVCLSIKDNGIGIPQENLSSIFNPFFTTKPVGEGTGLGLSISYDIIVNKHHGSIEVQSTYGEGTEFKITLPVDENAS